MKIASRSTRGHPIRAQVPRAIAVLGLALAVLACGPAPEPPPEPASGALVETVELGVSFDEAGVLIDGAPAAPITSVSLAPGETEGAFDAQLPIEDADGQPSAVRLQVQLD